MCEAAMAPEVSIADAKVKSDDIGVQEDRASHTKYPGTLWKVRFVKNRSDTERCDGV